MRKINFEVGKCYNYDYGDLGKLTILCNGTSCGYGEFALVGIEGNFNAKDTPYAMLTIKALCRDTTFFIRTSVNCDDNGSYEYDYIDLYDGMLCATEGVK